MNNPLRHVGQTARPEETAPDSQSGDAGALQQHPREKPAGADAQLPTPPAKKDIPDLKPGQAPPESSAGS